MDSENIFVDVNRRLYLTRNCISLAYLHDRCHAQDAYMPKDASKLGHRGIGFVTFASPDTVEQVCHPCAGNDLACVASDRVFRWFLSVSCVWHDMSFTAPLRTKKGARQQQSHK